MTPPHPPPQGEGDHPQGGGGAYARQDRAIGGLTSGNPSTAYGGPPPPVGEDEAAPHF